MAASNPDSMTLNDRGCLLLTAGDVSGGLEAFKAALPELKREIQAHSTILLPASSSKTSLYQDRETHNGSADFCACPILDPLTLSRRETNFRLYTNPLPIQLGMRNGASDAFTVTFNVALATHMQGIEHFLRKDSDAANHSFLVSSMMYRLTLHQSNCVESDALIVNTRNDHVYAAIFNNLAHVYAMLGNVHDSQTYADQLLKTLFYLVDSGRVISPQEMATHKAFMKNGHDLTMASLTPAKAA